MPAKATEQIQGGKLMNRIALHDPETGLRTGTWFDRDRANRYEEAARWDGHNYVSEATGSQWDHETLYRTATGRYVLHRWSQRQGVGESYIELPQADGDAWLVAQDHAEALPPEAVAERDLDATGPTPQRTIRMDDDLWQAAQARARAEGTDASALIRRLLTTYLA